MTQNETGDGARAPATAQELVLGLRVLTRAVQDFLAARAKEQGLGSTDFIALIRASNGQGVTGAQLAQAFGMRSSSVTALADRLQAKGLIARRPHPTDRRTILLHATRRGQSTITRALGPLLQHLLAQANERDDQQRATITAFLNDINNTLHTSAPPATTTRARPNRNP